MTAGDCPASDPYYNGENSRMNYGFIGAGAIALALVRRLTAVGESDIVLSNSREPATLAPLARRFGVRAGTRADAAAAEVVVLAVQWSRIPAALNGLDLDGRVLIDTTNPLEAPTFQPFDLGGLTSSEVVAGHAHGARVVKAFNTHSPEKLGSNPEVDGGRRVIFYSGDEAGALTTVGFMIQRLGFAGVPLGDLATGGRLHQFPGGPLPSRDFIERR
ncbi:NADPH-dependent F420 reductase [Pseudonocardia sp. CA-142604]|uniref:NADPH-dependent F420 reductase n=1 Tax=Pseudonocardia sp. CA-142604 TaxID=3240024 RepID=UPI003D90C12E